MALAGLSLAFGETLELGHSRYALAAAIACAAAPLASAVGNVAIKRAGGALDAIVLNGWAMLGGRRAAARVSALAEAWEVAWSARAIGSIAYLAVVGSAVPFVTLTVLLRELPAVTVSYITLLLPFGALAFGAALYDERVTLPAVGGAALVAAGLPWPSGPAGLSLSQQLRRVDDLERLVDRGRAGTRAGRPPGRGRGRAVARPSSPAGARRRGGRARSESRNVSSRRSRQMHLGSSASTPAQLLVERVGVLQIELAAQGDLHGVVLQLLDRQRQAPHAIPFPRLVPLLTIPRCARQ